jgi:hypothetical protein
VYGSLAPLPWARRVVDGAVGHVAFRSIALTGPGWRFTEGVCSHGTFL